LEIYIDKYRKKRIGGTSEYIQIDRWRDHFMELLGATHEKVVLEIGSEKEEETEGRTERIEEITRKELIKVVKKVKRAKTPGENGIENMEIHDKRGWRGILEISQQNIEGRRYSERLE